MNFVIKIEEFCMMNEEFCIKNEELCIEMMMVLQQDGSIARGDGSSSPYIVPNNGHLPPGLSWNGFQQQFKGYPNAVVAKQWAQYMKDGDRWMTLTGTYYGEYVYITKAIICTCFWV